MLEEQPQKTDKASRAITAKVGKNLLTINILLCLCNPLQLATNASSQFFSLLFMIGLAKI